MPTISFRLTATCPEVVEAISRLLLCERFRLEMQSLRNSQNPLHFRDVGAAEVLQICQKYNMILTVCIDTKLLFKPHA